MEHRQRRPVMEVLRDVELDQQLSITCRLDHNPYDAYIIGRSGSDFTDDDLEVAAAIQRVLFGLDRQITLTRQFTQPDRLTPDAVGLTVREYAVLGLIAEGQSTQMIAHQLQCSPRTVNKHLEHIYRKLGVNDRLNAVRTAKLWRIC